MEEDCGTVLESRGDAGESDYKEGMWRKPFGRRAVTLGRMLR